MIFLPTSVLWQNSLRVNSFPKFFPNLCFRCIFSPHKRVRLTWVIARAAHQPRIHRCRSSRSFPEAQHASAILQMGLGTFRLVIRVRLLCASRLPPSTSITNLASLEILYIFITCPGLLYTFVFPNPDSPRSPQKHVYSE